MLLNNGRGLEKRSTTSRHQSQRQPQATAAGTRNPTTEGYNNANTNTAANPYGRSQPPMNTNPPPQQQHEYEDSSRKKGFWKQFISFVTCGLFTCT